MRRQFIAGNWKLNKTIGESIALVKSIKEKSSDLAGVDIVVAPPFTALNAVQGEISDSNIKLAGQNFFWESSGAYTGEISAEMLSDAGCAYSLIGHSERRQLFSETDETVNKKVKIALNNKLIPIVCVGETLAHREAGITQKVVEGQISAGLKGLSPEEGRQLVIAYEPIWAIGTGRNATPQQANEVHAHIREHVKGIFGEEVSDSKIILYGGSVKPSNSAELLSQNEIDGVLVGGASLDADSFVSIAKSASMI